LKHGQHGKRTRQGAVLAIVIVVAIFAVLASVEAGMFTTDATKRCALQLPRWFGCALANHEGLAGGLIGAGGALFAGWLAWNGALRQIAAAELPSLLDAHARTLRQIYALSYARNYVATVLERFSTVPPQDGVALINELQKVYAQGGLTQPVMPQASRENGLRVEHIVRTLREVATRVCAAQLPASPAAEAVDARLRDLRQTFEDINSELELARVQAAHTELQIKSRGHNSALTAFH